MDLTCGRLLYPGHCGESATWHFAWTDDAENGVENGLCCDKHASEAWAASWGVDWHPITQICTLPGAQWVGSIADPPGYCKWPLEDGSEVRAATVEEAVRA